MSRVLPILYNTDMVRAILGGRKTVTRRILKEQPPAGIKAKKADGIGFYWAFWEDGDKHWLKCPYDVGDILYVRETWCRWYLPHGEWRYEYRATSPNGNKRPTGREYDDKWETRPWRPSIHMPKEAARIWLKVTDVRVERLQDITEEQAIKEGISRLYDDLSDAEYIDWAKRIGIYPKEKEDWGYKNYLWHGHFGKRGTGNWKSDNWDYQYSSYDNAVGSYSSLWNSTIKKSDLGRYGWDANPGVWVIEFERCEKPEPCILAGMEPAEDKRPCIGYGTEQSDEPCEMCKGCNQCTGNDDFERCGKPENI